LNVQVGVFFPSRNEMLALCVFYQPNLIYCCNTLHLIYSKQTTNTT
jgi:hypothetical protein